MRSAGLALRALRADSFKYIDAPGPELYDLEHDPGETHNLAKTDPVRAQALRTEMSRLLVRYRAAESHAGPATPQDEALLRSLGYLSRGPRNRAAGAAPPDPKDRLAELHLYEKSEDAVTAGRMSEAIALLNRVLAEDPQNTLARRDLGMVYATGGDFARARACFEKVLAAAPDDYLSHYELGIVYDRLGQRKEAVDQIQTACELAPLSQPCRVELEKLKRPSN